MKSRAREGAVVEARSRMKHARSLSVLVLAAVIAGVWVSRAEPEPAQTASVFFAPSGKDRRIHKALEELLGEATKTVDIAMYQFTSPQLGDLVKKTARKAKVRLLIDSDQVKGSYSQDKGMRAKDNIEVRYVRLPGEGAEREKFHNKFCVVDGQVVATGSFNWTVLADEKNYENLLVLRDAKIAQEYAAEFDRVWNDDKVTSK